MNTAVDDRTSVLTVVIAFSLKPQQIRDWTELPWERVNSTLADLTRRDIVRSGGGHYFARQRECAHCSRPGRELKGEAVYIDPESLSWYCGACWDAEVERISALVEGSLRIPGSALPG